MNSVITQISKVSHLPENFQEPSLFSRESLFFLIKNFFTFGRHGWSELSLQHREIKKIQAENKSLEQLAVRILSEGKEIEEGIKNLQCQATQEVFNRVILTNKCCSLHTTYQNLIIKCSGDDKVYFSGNYNLGLFFSHLLSFLSLGFSAVYELHHLRKKITHLKHFECDRLKLVISQNIKKSLAPLQAELTATSKLISQLAQIKGIEVLNIDTCHSQCTKLLETKNKFTQLTTEYKALDFQQVAIGTQYKILII